MAELEHFPTYSYRMSSLGNALDRCFDEHLYPMGAPIRSDDALELSAQRNAKRSRRRRDSGVQAQNGP
jgi:hypothetical protein